MIEMRLEIVDSFGHEYTILEDIDLEEVFNWIRLIKPVYINVVVADKEDIVNIIINGFGEIPDEEDILVKDLEEAFQHIRQLGEIKELSVALGEREEIKINPNIVEYFGWMNSVEVVILKVQRLTETVDALRKYEKRIDRVEAIIFNIIIDLMGRFPNINDEVTRLKEKTQRGHQGI